MIYALDDDRTILEALRQAFDERGHRIHASSLWSELAAPLIQAGADRNAAVLICDLQMPGISGADFCRIVRRHNRTAKIIIFTARPGDAEPGVGDVVVDKAAGLDTVVREAERLLSGAQALSAPPSAVEGSRVLLVEDEDAARLTMRLALQREGYVVDAVDTGDAALEKLAAGRYDVAISDIRLPGQADGLAVLERAKELYPTMPVVLISAFGNAELLRTALRLRCDDFLDKPFDAATLLWAVNQTLSRPAQPS